jgi:hypothetical protein
LADVRLHSGLFVRRRVGLGLFALIVAFVVKFAKIFILGALTLLGAVAKFWKHGAKENAPVTVGAQNRDDSPKT